MSFVKERAKRGANRRRALLTGALVAGALVALPATASAIVVQTPNGPASYMPLNGQGPASPSRFAANGNLDYHGGPVMPSNKQFAIFWQPPGTSFPAGYASGITTFMKDVVRRPQPADRHLLGRRAVQGLERQVRDVDDVIRRRRRPTPTAFPTSGCPPYAGIATELHGLPDRPADLERGRQRRRGERLPARAHEPVLRVPAAGDRDLLRLVGHRGRGASTTSSARTTRSTAPAEGRSTRTRPSPPSTRHGCGTGNYPNGKASGIDDQLSTLSHETNEAREDPLLNAWFNSQQRRRRAPTSAGTPADDYGAFLGGTPGVNGFNQIINGRHYILQRDWSNAANGCEQRYNLSGTTFGPFRRRSARR